MPKTKSLRLLAVAFYCFICGFAFMLSIEKAQASEPCCRVNGIWGAMWVHGGDGLCHCSYEYPWCYQHPDDAYCHCELRCIQ